MAAVTIAFRSLPTVNFFAVSQRVDAPLPGTGAWITSQPRGLLRRWQRAPPAGPSSASLIPRSAFPLLPEGGMASRHDWHEQNSHTTKRLQYLSPSNALKLESPQYPPRPSGRP